MRRVGPCQIVVASCLCLAPCAQAAEILTFVIGQDWQNRIIERFGEHRTTEIDAIDIATVNFSAFDVVYLSDNYNAKKTPAYATALAARAGDIEAYVRGGGRLIVGVQAYGGASTANGDEYAFLPPVLVRGLQPGQRLFGDFVRHADPQHPLFRPFPHEEECRRDPHFLCLSYWGSSYHGALPMGLLPVLAIDDSNPPLPLIRGGRIDAGRLLVWTLDPDQHDTPAAQALVSSALDWMLCSDEETLEAVCETERGVNVVRAQARGGMEGAQVTFRLDDQPDVAGRFDKEGVVDARWDGVRPGQCAVEIELSCGDVLFDTVECPLNRCSGDESFKAVCNATNEGTEYKTILRGGFPTTAVVFELEGQTPIEAIVDDNGRATAVWLGLEPGRHVSRVHLACGDRLRSRARCP